MRKSRTLNELITINVQAMFGSIRNGRFQQKNNMKKIVKESAADEVAYLRGKKQRVLAAEEYDKDSYKGQTIRAIISDSKKILSITDNRPDTFGDEFSLTGLTMKEIMETYRSNNNLKCGKFIYRIDNTGARFTNQAKFMKAIEEYIES